MNPAIPGFLAAFAIAAVAPLCCQQPPAPNLTEAICGEALQTPLPAEASQAAPPQGGSDCNSYKLYFGLGAPADVAAARQCAWKERLAEQAGNFFILAVARHLGGSAMLAVLYANGEGVSRNIPLAQRFACEADLGQRALTSLAALAAPNPAAKKFRYCDFARTTIQFNVCALLASELAAQQRSEKLQLLSAPWTPAQQAAFQLAEHAHEAYVLAHGQGETYLGGTIRVIRVNAVEERLRDDFLAAVEDFETGHLPRGTRGDRARANTALNRLYRKTLAAAAAPPKRFDPGAIRPAGIRDAQCAWLAYRVRWVAFARLRYPSIPAAAWLAVLAADRTANLQTTLCAIQGGGPSCPPLF